MTSQPVHMYRDRWQLLSYKLIQKLILSDEMTDYIVRFLCNLQLKKIQKTFSTFYKTKIWKNRKEIKKEEEGEDITKVNFTNLKNVL